MGSAIEWTDETWNPTLGCSRVSPGCDNCYAERESSGRLNSLPAYAGLTVGRKWTGEIREIPDRLDKPLRWKRPRRVFVNSMSDLFADQVSDVYIARVFAIMALANQHTFQVLTKRPQRMASLLGRAGAGNFWTLVAAALRGDHGDTESRERLLDTLTRVDGGGVALPNVWLGTSIESQTFAFRARHLLETPAAVRFVSAEPLLGPLDLSPWLTPSMAETVDWVIVGGESGPNARPMRPEWARSLRDQCQRAGTAFLFKQWGEWVPEDTWLRPRMWRIGKHEAGRHLDGRLWDEYPA